MTQTNPGPEGTYLPGGQNNDPKLPETSPTIGTKLTHSMLRIRDPHRSLHFYIDLLGMRTVCTMNAGPFTMYYLGIPSTPADRADLSAWAARISHPPTLSQTPGLLELFHIHGTEKPVAEGGYEMSTGNCPPNLGFGHLGFSVPDVNETLERLRGEGVPVLKELGDAGRESVPLSAWEEGKGVGVGSIHANYGGFFEQIAYVADPDGYVIELLPQNWR
ncbi:putative lactoylglutathione lyase [Aspergillus avenaceus]|uniref:Putative lactoylglutathione lyase n=1 Tax=Aspergillus avenaceus TaxID=36643 RepID=A0A5N6TVG6_ASPAV|nr:putative lactoylglutathione lyase [Aspergillus avenaceus]